jgi:hypothetical protein
VSGEQDRLVSVTTATGVLQLAQAMAGFGANGPALDSGLVGAAANDPGMHHMLAVHAHHG